MNAMDELARLRHAVDLFEADGDEMELSLGILRRVLTLEPPTDDNPDLYASGWIQNLHARVYGYAETEAEIVKVYTSKAYSIDYTVWPFNHINWDAAVDDLITSGMIDMFWWFDGWVILRREWEDYAASKRRT